MKYFNNFNGHQSLLENMAQAKAIIRKKGIDEENEIFQKIIEVTSKDGFTGFITKIVFKDGVDLQEALDLYGDLKSKSIDVGKLSKLNYAQVLDMVYDESDTSNVEFVFKYDNYSVFHVKDYESGLKICSPSWCLKTKRYWDDYMVKKKGHQFVAIQDKAYEKRRLLLTTPDTNLTGEYSNTKQPQIRYGITIYPSGKFDYFDDDNKTNSYNIPKEVNELVEKIKYYISQNPENFEDTRSPEKLKDYDNLADIISTEINDMSGSFDNGIYKEDKNFVPREIERISEETNLSVEAINNFFRDYKDEILADDRRFTAINGVSDILLYHFYGADAHSLSGLRLDERESDASSYKYIYGFYKHYWGRQYIKQSFGSVTNWFKHLATKKFGGLIGVDSDYGSSILYSFDIDVDSIEIDINNFTDVEEVDNGAIIEFRVDSYMSTIGLSQDATMTYYGKNGKASRTFKDYLKYIFDDNIKFVDNYCVIELIDTYEE